jgi:hypothetical protein
LPENTKLHAVKLQSEPVQSAIAIGRLGEFATQMAKPEGELPDEISEVKTLSSQIAAKLDQC